jgi:hypothetical protein
VMVGVLLVGEARDEGGSSAPVPLVVLHRARAAQPLRRRRVLYIRRFSSDSPNPECACTPPRGRFSPVREVVTEGAG